MWPILLIIPIAAVLSVTYSPGGSIIVAQGLRALVISSQTPQPNFFLNFCWLIKKFS